MLEATRSNINFSGKDGFHWFIGQVTADKAWRDKNNQNTNNGYRAKVRILGHHPAENKDQGGIDDTDLPWAHFLVPPSMGAGHNHSGTSFAVQGGETVFGFFLDGEDGQQPVILGSFFSNSNITPFKTWEKVMEEGTSGFAPFTADASIETGKHITPTHGKKQSDHGGLPDSNTEVIEQPEDAVGESGLREAGETFSDYKKRIKTGGPLITDKPTHLLEVGEANSETVALANAEKNKSKGGNSEKSGNDIKPSEEEDPLPTEEEDTFVGTINKHYDNKVYEVKVAQKCADPKGALGDVSKILQKFTDEVSALEKFEDGYIDPVINRIVDMDKLIEKASIKISGGFSATIRHARKEMFKEINEKVNESVNFLDPAHLIKNLEVKKQQDTAYCLMENLINGLKNFVGDFLKGMVGNLVQMPLCAAEQFIGGLISDITDKIQSAIAPAMGAISGLSGASMPDFSSMMDKALKIAQTGLKFLECEGQECESDPIDWKTNQGADPKKKLDPSRMLGLAKGLSGMGGLGDMALGGLEGMFPGIGTIKNALDNPLDAIGGALGGGAISDVLGLDIAGGLQNIKGLGSNITSVAGNFPLNALGLPVGGPMSALVGGCNPFQKECGPPKLELFGGGGVGAAGKAVINSIGEVVGVSMDDLGIGYTKPPFVSFVDNCGNGKGATGTADVDLNPESPTYGQVTNVIVTNPGGGYLGPIENIDDTIAVTDDGLSIDSEGGVISKDPILGSSVGGTGGTGGGQTGGVDPVTGVVDDPNQTDGTGGGTGNVGNDSTSDQTGVDVIGEVTGIQILGTGMKYSDGDMVKTSNGGALRLKVDPKGRIIGSVGTTDAGFTRIPTLSIDTKTGYGAIIRPITKFVKRQDYKDPITQDITLIRVVDCPRGF